MFKRFPTFFTAIGSALLLFMSSCGAAESLLGSVNQAGGSGGTLSETESQLYEDGPVELPVTIAKLEAPDVDKITVTVAPTTAPDLSGPLGTVTQAYTMTVVGTAGAVEFTQTPYVQAYRLDGDDHVLTGSLIEAGVAADGSFGFEIGVDEIDGPVVFFAVDPTRTLASPMLTAIENVILTTNAENLDSNQTLSGRDKQYLVSVTGDDGVNRLIRMHKDGSEPEVILESEDPIEETATQGGRISYTDPTGTLNLLIPEISLQTPLTVIPSYDRVKIKIMMTDGGVFLLQFGDIMSLDFFDVADVTQTALITDEEGFADLKVAQSIADELIYVATEDGDGQHSFYRVDVGNISNSTWSAREKIRDVEVDGIKTLDASDAGTLVFESEEAGESKIYALNCDEDCLQRLDSESDPEVYVNPKINADATIVTACRLGDGVTVGNQLVYHRFGVDALGTMTRLTLHDEVDTCSASPRSYFIDEENKIHFYRGRLGSASPQHAIIDLGRISLQ